MTGQQRFEWLMTFLGQLWCGLWGGHNKVLHFEGERMFMRCTHCNHDSPGWEIKGERPQIRYAGDPRRHVITKETEHCRNMTIPGLR